MQGSALIVCELPRAWKGRARALLAARGGLASAWRKRGGCEGRNDRPLSRKRSLGCVAARPPPSFRLRDSQRTDRAEVRTALHLALGESAATSWTLALCMRMVIALLVLSMNGLLVITCNYSMSIN